MTIQSQSQSRKQRLSLFSERGEVAPDAAKVQGATPTAKTAGDLLLDFEHANIALSLRVGLSRQLHRLHLLRKEFSR